MIRALASRDTTAVTDALEEAPLINLFLLHCLDVNGVDRDLWYGRWLGKELVALGYLVPGRIFVPWARTAADARPLGEWLHGKYAPCLMVGPRAPCDALWDAWTQSAEPLNWYDQQLYTTTRVRSPQHADGFRLAQDRDWKTIAEQSAAYALEDLGEHAPDSDASQIAHVVRERIRDGRTFVLTRGDDIVFHVHVGARGAHGCMVGGTYVPPTWRGRGIASAGMRATCAALLQRWPTITLHVNEANLPAVRLYETVGFQPHAPFRLATPKQRT